MCQVPCARRCVRSNPFPSPQPTRWALLGLLFTRRNEGVKNLPDLPEKGRRPRGLHLSAGFREAAGESGPATSCPCHLTPSSRSLPAALFASCSNPDSCWRPVLSCLTCQHTRNMCGAWGARRLRSRERSSVRMETCPSLHGSFWGRLSARPSGKHPLRSSQDPNT